MTDELQPNEVAEDADRPTTRCDLRAIQESLYRELAAGAEPAELTQLLLAVE